MQLATHRGAIVDAYAESRPIQWHVVRAGSGRYVVVSGPQVAGVVHTFDCARMAITAAQKLNKRWWQR